jgi:hypothetical protein
LSGLGYGILFALGLRYLGSVGWTAALVAGVITGPLFGVGMAVFGQQMQRLLAPSDDGLSRDKRGTAIRASQCGPVPSDPAVRAAALEFARRQLALLGPRWIRFVIGLVVASSVLDLGLTVLDNDRDWWQLIRQVCGVVIPAALLFQPRHLRRRIALLSDERSDTPAD